MKTEMTVGDGLRSNGRGDQRRCIIAVFQRLFESRDIVGVFQPRGIAGKTVRERFGNVGVIFRKFAFHHQRSLRIALFTRQFFPFFLEIDDKIAAFHFGFARRHLRFAQNAVTFFVILFGIRHKRDDFRAFRRLL